MASDRTEYPAMLPLLPPAQAVDVLNDRVRQVTRLNLTIADWLLERRRLEEQYASGLRKLARSQVDEADLGVFSIPWSSLTNSMDALAEAHTGLATKIEVDVERPLREFPTSSREMQALSSVQGNLAALAKDIDKAQSKAEKLQTRGERLESNKAANASSDLAHARNEWESQAAYVFERLQDLDEARIAQLRDALTQFLTLEADQVEKSRVATEQSLNVVLNVETADEIKTFAIKTVSNIRRPSVSRGQQRVSFAPPSGSSRAFGSSSNLATIPSNTDDDRIERTPSASEGKKSGLKGLKRLGTVMGRRKDKDKESKQTASTLPSTAETPEPDRSRRFTTFGRLGRSKDSYSLDQAQDEPSPSQRPRSPMRVGSEILEPPSSQQDLEPAPQLPALNGIHGHQDDFAGPEPPTVSQHGAPQIPATDLSRESEGFSVPLAGTDPISLAQAEADAAHAHEEDATPQMFSLNIRNAPIQEEGSDVALASMANKLQAPPPTTRRSGTVRGRRDARNSAIVNTTAQPEYAYSEPTSIATSAAEPLRSIPAPAPISAPVQAIAPPSAPAAHPFPTPTTTLTPPPPLSEISAPLPANTSAFIPPAGAIAAMQAEAFRPSSRANPVLDQVADNQSIRSGRSATTTASQGVRHPELHEAGLNSSIVETVSAHFDQGKLSSASLFGEIALVYNPADFTTPLGPETIRLENFASLDKVALNPAFITQSSDKEGEYSVSLAGISRTQVAFKYQLRADEANAHAPLLIAPALRIEPSQTSIIVGYSLNPAFDLRGQSSITLSNVMLALTLEGARALSCQSKPVGTFSREKNLIFWQLGDIVLRPGAPAEKLLARFVTDSEARGGSIESRWEIHSDAAHGVGSGLAISSLQHHAGADPFADDNGALANSWKPVPTVRKLASGNYVAKS